MTMNTTRLITHWSVGEAANAIDFLDSLRDALWHTYGEQITTMHRQAHDQRIRDNHQRELEFDDDIPF